MITVRAEQPGDEPAIHAVHAVSFPTDAEARLVDALRSGGRLAASLVAADATTVVGHIAFSPVSVGNTSGGLGLAPLAVLAGWRRRGVAAQLVHAGLAACERAGATFVVVLGEPAYYEQFGFRPARRWGLRDEYGGGDAFQALELRPGVLARCGELVRYALEFTLVA